MSQQDIIEQVRKYAALLPKSTNDTQYAELITQLLKETALNTEIDMAYCFDQVQSDVVEHLSFEKRSLYSPLSVPNIRYPVVSLSSELRVWGVLRKLENDLANLLNYRVISNLTEEDFRKALMQSLPGILKDKNVNLNQQEMKLLICFLIDDVFYFGPLEVLLLDPSVSDILVNGHDHVFVDRHGQLFPTTISFRDGEHLIHVIKKLVNQAGRRIDMSTPYVDARLPDGSRINAVLPPLAVDVPVLSIRRFASARDSLDRLICNGTVSGEIAAFLSLLVRCHLNIIVLGGTGSGKTTLLNALSWAIDSNERLVTIEDAAELNLHQPHVIRLETRQANMRGDGAITQRDLVVNALRMRPDRIIVGEVRGKEAFDMLQAMNVGHDGSMTTLHANSPEECIARMVNMVLMSDALLSEKSIVDQIVSVVDVVVQISRLRDGKRRLIRIAEVLKMPDGKVVFRDMFSFHHDISIDEMGRYKKHEIPKPHWYSKIVEHGYAEQFSIFYPNIEKEI